MQRNLSMTPGAIRSRRFRNGEKQRADEEPRKRTASKPPPPVASAEPTSVPPPKMHATEPFTASTTDMPYPGVPFVVEEGAPEDAPAPPIVEPAAEPPPPPRTSPEQAKLYAKGVSQFVLAGFLAMLAKHPGLMAPGGPLVGVVTKENLAMALTFYEGAAERVIIKYDVTIPYADEALVAVGIGIAAYGMFGKSEAPKGNVANAKNANVPQTEGSSEPVEKPEEAGYSIRTGSF